jgi:hypothetical protein
MPFAYLVNLSYIRNLSWAILIGWLSIIRVCAYEYEADGMLEGETHSARGDVVKEEPVSFKIYVRDCQWLIHITQQNDSSKYREIGFDGHTMYYSAMLDEKVVANMNPKPALWTGGLSLEAVPFNGVQPNIPVIWLALASSCYLDDAKDHLIPPYSTDAVRGSLPALVSRMNDLLKLPQAITFFDDGFSRKYGVPRQRPPPFDKGFTNAIYTVNTFTNIGGYNLPREFTLEVFLPASSNVVLFTKYNGIVDNVKSECSLTHFTPEPGGVGFVNDFRFISVGATRKTGFYYDTNRWLSMNEVEALPGFSNYTYYEQLKKNEPTVIIHGNEVPTTVTPTMRRNVKCFLYAFIFCSSFACILFCFRYRKNEQTNNNKNHENK